MFQVNFVISLLIASAAVASTDYQKRYGTDSPFKKLTDSKGKGDERLYGTRSFRVVLYGVLYRGGGLNHVHRSNPRNNMNPMQEDGLTNLCKEGFSAAVYTYKHRFETAPKHLRCSSIRGSNQGFDYLQLSPSDEDGRHEFLRHVHRVIESGAGPIYVHCWNGWHASGLAAALALRQFCGVSGAEASAYWEATLDGTSENYQGVLRRIRDFQPYPELTISASRQKQICPSLAK